VTFLAKINLGGAANDAQTEALHSPSKLPWDDELVRDVKARYIP
jgi:hypothetical protein